MSAAAELLVPGARHAVAPAGIMSTAWPRVRKTCNNIGWRFDPWQEATGRLILARAAGGKWAADLSILSIPRQVGKSYLLGCVIFALCLLNPRLRVIWTSHHTATTEEMFEAMKELAGHKRVAPHVTKCSLAGGPVADRVPERVAYRLRCPGTRVRPWQGPGRGAGAGRVPAHHHARAVEPDTDDEHRREPADPVRRHPAVAEHDNAEAFTMRRKAAIEGISSDTLYVEFSADDDANLDDRKQWAKANPSFPKRTPERAFLLNRKILDDDTSAASSWGSTTTPTVTVPCRSPGGWTCPPRRRPAARPWCSGLTCPGTVTCGWPWRGNAQTATRR